MKTILITGGSGLIGSAATNYFLEKGYSIRHLGREKKGKKIVQEFVWNPDSLSIEAGALDGVDVVIHLAGANVGKGRWTEDQKKKIIESRTQSTALLHQTLQRQSILPEKLICASAMGYYGVESSPQPFRETDGAGSDFMARVCVEWERETEKLSALQIPVVIYRIGVVLDNHGGALPLMKLPVELGLGAPVGDGKQKVSWIHNLDIIRMFEFAIEKEDLKGTFNAAAPVPVTNKEFTKLLGKVLHRPVWPISVPSGLMRLLLGEQADIILRGVEVSSEKITSEGFDFRFQTLEPALKDLLRN